MGPRRSFNICMPSKIWKLKPQAPKELFNSQPDYSLLLAQLLYNRGLAEREEVEAFIDPKYEMLPDPFLFQDMQKAVDRIWQALKNGEGVCIYGDYDADAVTANAVLRQTFRYLGTEVESYIPDRFTEGYGLNLDAFEKIKARGSKVVITVDCGTNSTEVADWCLKNGIDLIITDHHEVIGNLPKVFALINPKNPADKYPFQEITGVGVAFKLACGLLNSDKRQETRDKIKGWEKWLLDLVAIGTVADCHSLLGENRILVKYGLQVLAKTKWPGLKALMDAAGVDALSRPIDAYTLGFVIAPRLNAAGRLEHADKALNLLVEPDADKATERAQDLNNINVRRQQMTERVLSEAKSAAEFIKDRKVIVLMNEDWPLGIVGLVAGRIAEVFNRPAFILRKGVLEATGSARTVGEFNVVEALKHAAEYLTRFGGHKQAAGLSLKPENFDLFYQKILEYADNNLSQEDLNPILELEAELDASHLSLATCHLLQQLEPFGMDNAKPVFLIKNLKLLSLRSVGGSGQHLQLQLQKDGVKISAIAFNMGYLEKTLKIGDTLDAAAELMRDDWNGNSRVKLKIVDLKVLN